MNDKLYLSKVLRAIQKIKMKGVLEAAFCLRYTLYYEINRPVQQAMKTTFGEGWEKYNQERRNYQLLRAFISENYEVEFCKWLKQECIKFEEISFISRRLVLTEFYIEVLQLTEKASIVCDIDPVV